MLTAAQLATTSRVTARYNTRERRSSGHPKKARTAGFPASPASAWQAHHTQNPAMARSTTFRSMLGLLLSLQVLAQSRSASGSPSDSGSPSPTATRTRSRTQFPSLQSASRPPAGVTAPSDDPGLEGVWRLQPEQPLEQYVNPVSSNIIAFAPDWANDQSYDDDFDTFAANQQAFVVTIRSLTGPLYVTLTPVRAAGRGVVAGAGRTAQGPLVRRACRPAPGALPPPPHPPHTHALSSHHSWPTSAMSPPTTSTRWTP